MVLVNAASGIGTIDVSIDGTNRVEGLEAGLSADEIMLAEESYEFQVLTDGKLIVELSQQIRAGYAYTALLLNDTAPGTFKIVFLQGQTPPQTRVRLTHVAATVPDVAIYLDDEKALTVGISYSELLPFETISSKTYRVRVVTTGSDPQTLLSTNISLTPNRTVDLVLLGEATDLRLLQVDVDTSTLAPDTTRLIIVNAIPGETQARAISVNNREVRVRFRMGTSNPIELNLNGNGLYLWAGRKPNRMSLKTHAPLILWQAKSIPIFCPRQRWEASCCCQLMLVWIQRRWQRGVILRYCQPMSVYR